MENSYIPNRPLFRWALSLILSFGLCLPLMAQHQVSGTVVDPGGEAIIGANVSVKGTTNGSITNIDGQFELTVEDPQATLLITFVGFLSQEIEINGRSEFDITLLEDIKQLDELVVIGYGVQKKRVVTGAIASVDEDQIKKVPAVRADQLLQGRAAGVQVVTNTGQPGSGLTIRVRGNGTVNNGNPMYIVDGMPVDNLQFLNPNDIASIDVLKDGASAAIYGARAANGVVLVTTKSGKAGKTKLSYDTYFGIQNPWRQVQMLNAREYMVLRNEASVNSGKALPFTNEEIQAFGKGTDWQDALFNYNAPTVRHQFELTGGNDKSTISTSFAYNGQEGIVGGEKSKYERYNFRLSASQKLNDKLKLSTRLNYIRSKQRAVDPNSEFNSPVMLALNMDPLTPVYQDNKDILATYPDLAVTNADGRYYGISPYVGQEVVNPLAKLETMYGETLSDHFLGNATLNYELIEGLTFRSMMGAEVYEQVDQSYTPLFQLNGQTISNRTSAYKQSGKNLKLSFDNTISYHTSFGDHNLKLLGGTSAITQRYENVGGVKYDLATSDPELAFISMGTSEDDMVAFGGANHSSLLSFFGRVSYDYNEKYLFQAIMRADGSSKFGANNRFGYFPSVSAGWVLSEESFLKGNDFLSFLKLRASLGVNGNDRIGLYQYTSVIGNGAGYTLGNGTDVRFVNGAAPLNVSNPDLKWEETVQSNLAVDMRMMEDRFGISVDLYNKQTNGMLLLGTIPAHVGNNPPTLNIGSVLNRGIELDLNYKNQKGDFEYSTSFNIAYNQNEVTAINNESGVQDGASIHTYDVVSRSVVGMPIGYFWGYKTDGVFQNTSEVEAYTNGEGQLIQPAAQAGDLRFVDVNGDGAITVDDRTMIGNPTPDFTLGYTFNASYKGFDASLFLTGAFGQEILKMYRRNDLYGANMPASYLDRWRGEGTSNDLPRLTVGDANGNWSKMSDLYVEDGSYARIKSVQLGYTFKPKAGNMLGLSSARVYVLAENLFTFTNYTGLDPEVGMNGSANNAGIDRGSYPQARTFMLGANITF